MSNLHIQLNYHVNLTVLEPYKRSNVEMYKGKNRGPFG